MFAGMHENTKELLDKFSTSDLYRLSLQPQHDEFLFLHHWAGQPIFWADVCKWKYRIRPFEADGAKVFFQAEYLFEQKRYAEAAAKNSYRALDHFHNRFITEKNYTAALLNAQKITSAFGVVGIICTLTIYYEMTQTGTENATTYATKALAELESWEKLTTDDKSNYYLQVLGWKEALEKSPHQSVENYKAQMKDFFEQFVHTNANVLRTC